MARKGNSRSPALQMRMPSWKIFYAFTTRFLIGTGGLLTTAFVGDARAFLRRNEAPLLAAPPRTSIRHVWDDAPYRPICAGANQHALLADQLNGLIELATQ